jgi:glycerol-3-phosphate dehydrogenase
MWHIHLSRRSDGSPVLDPRPRPGYTAGPWVADLFAKTLSSLSPSPDSGQPYRRYHLIVPKANRPVLQNEDRRIVFAIPYQEQFAGTTFREYKGDPANVAITEEKPITCGRLVSTHFKKQVQRGVIL